MPSVSWVRMSNSRGVAIAVFRSRMKGDGSSGWRRIKRRLVKRLVEDLLGYTNEIMVTVTVYVFYGKWE